MLKTRRFFRHAQRIAPLVALISLAACGACNCNVPGFIAGLGGGTPGATPTPTPTIAGATPTPTPTIAPLACSQAAPVLGAALATFAVLAATTVYGRRIHLDRVNSPDGHLLHVSLDGQPEPVA